MSETPDYIIPVGQVVDMYDCLLNIKTADGVFLSVSEGYEYSALENKYRFLNRVFEPTRKWPKQAGGKYVMLSVTELVTVTLNDFTEEISILTKKQVKVTLFIAAQLLLTDKEKWLVAAKILWRLDELKKAQEQFEKERRFNLDDTLPVKLPDDEEL